eukprot:CAMPEP_0173250352 /NCGR_PEP_ID=MMETSP1142-20121109/19533_1 /TAXON_ID=483371 /ORGANISM="non described non described, Strain CCMP2298" /LENGTH=171 /DNA_ID=CAMNT_0014183093 /DNA_START=41 /DNA_END=553 /DNA_ORIENTATION=+
MTRRTTNTYATSASQWKTSPSDIPAVEPLADKEEAAQCVQLRGVRRVALDAALDEFPLDAALDEFPLEGLDQGQGMQGIQGMQEPFAGPDMHLMQLGLQQGLQGLQGQQGQRQLGLGQSAPKVTTSIRSGPRSSAASVSALASCAPTSLSIAPIFAPAPSTSAPTAPVSDS